MARRKRWLLAKSNGILFKMILFLSCIVNLSICCGVSCFLGPLAQCKQAIHESVIMEPIPTLIENSKCFKYRIHNLSSFDILFCILGICKNPPPLPSPPLPSPPLPVRQKCEVWKVCDVSLIISGHTDHIRYTGVNKHPHTINGKNKNKNFAI